MAKYPFMTRRQGSKNLYYHARGRPKQIWRSLGTNEGKVASVAYRRVDAETDLLFERWLREEREPFASAESSLNPRAGLHSVTPLTPALLRRLADAHYLKVYDADFQWRCALWKRAQEAEEEFWKGGIIEHPTNDWHSFKGQEYSYYAYLMEEPTLEDVFFYCVFFNRKSRLRDLRRRYKLGSVDEFEAAAKELLQTQQVELASTDAVRLVRKLIEVEIRVLADLTAEDESTFDGILDLHTTTERATQLVAASAPGEHMSILMDIYLDQTTRTSEWPTKTVLRKRGELREFLEIAGDKPVNAYTQVDGVRFRDTQLALPTSRQRQPFKGLALVDAAKIASELRSKGEKVHILNAITVNDKIGTVAVFFNWAKARGG